VARYLFALIVVLAPAGALAQRLSPEQAVAVLRASHSLVDMTGVDLSVLSGPTVTVVPGDPTAGPFGAFPPPSPIAPLSRGPYVFGDYGRWCCPGEFGRTLVLGPWSSLRPPAPITRPRPSVRGAARTRR
jgi:hypothetical protein